MTIAKEEIYHKTDRILHHTGWCVQRFSEANPTRVSRLAIRDFPLARAYGSIDFLLFIDGKALALIEVIDKEVPLCGISVQSEKYSRGLPFSLRLYTRPLPFLYQTNGKEICFTNAFDPEPRPRTLHSLHQPETLKAWIEDGAVGETPRDMAAAYFPEYRRRGRTFHERVLINMPELVTKGLSSKAIIAVQTLEDGLKLNKRRILMTLSGKSERRNAMRLIVERLLRFVDTRRVLILLDQEKEINDLMSIFQDSTSFPDNRPFSESFPLQNLNKESYKKKPIDQETRVCVATIKALDSLLSGKAAISLPIESFEVIVLDECSETVLHRHKEALEYFDAYCIGFSETPDQRTRDFFNKDLSMVHIQNDGLNVLSS